MMPMMENTVVSAVCHQVCVYARMVSMFKRVVNAVEIYKIVIATSLIQMRRNDYLQECNVCFTRLVVCEFNGNICINITNWTT